MGTLLHVSNQAARCLFFEHNVSLARRAAAYAPGCLGFGRMAGAKQISARISDILLVPLYGIDPPCY